MVCMKFKLFLIPLLVSLSCFSQNKDQAIEVTPQTEKKIRDEVEKQIPSFQRTLQKEKLNQVQMEFAIDTFRIERFMEKLGRLNLTDAEMSDADYAEAKGYDSLLNKYYQKLLAVLKPDDKRMLIQTQKSWLSFRDAEYKLVETISKDEYSGGGTIQQLNESGTYLNLVKTRTIDIFEHYTRATQNE
jgi:uncharacterized protein YecT (DUF1311 family)